MNLVAKNLRFVFLKANAKKCYSFIVLRVKFNASKYICLKFIKIKTKGYYIVLICIMILKGVEIMTCEVIDHEIVMELSETYSDNLI
jgi:hypothetical protein